MGRRKANVFFCFLIRGRWVACIGVGVVGDSVTVVLLKQHLSCSLCASIQGRIAKVAVRVRDPHMHTDRLVQLR